MPYQQPNVILRDPSAGLRYHVRYEGEAFQAPPFVLWDYFPAPPQDATEVNVQLGRIGVLRGIPLS